MERGCGVPVLDTTRAFGASRVHVVGMAGTGVRGLVPLLVARGARVTGSDLNDSPVLEKLRGYGVECRVGHSDANVDPATDLVLISAAIRADNPELRVAAQRRIAVLKYAQCLGYLMSERQGIAVAGTHGKTTTSAMVAFTLLDAGLDPSFVIGGEYPAFGGGSRSGRGSHFIAEACEFDHSFLNLRPRAAAVTNIEEEHLDYFGSLEEIQRAFGQFASLLPEDGLLVYNGDDPCSAHLGSATRAPCATFSLRAGAADWWAEDVRRGERGLAFRIVGPGGQAARVRLSVPGRHNVRNALAAAALSSWAGVPLALTARALEKFTGVRRRFEVLAREPLVVIDDYAHHPTEVAAVIDAVRERFPGRWLTCVFQPHQHSRLRRMRDRFAAVLEQADETLVTRVYRARDSEEEARAVQSDALVLDLLRRGARCCYTPEFADVRGELARRARPGGVVVFLGAGDITNLASEFAEEATRSGPLPAPCGRGGVAAGA